MTDRSIVLLVIRILGTLAILLDLMVGFLAWRIIGMTSITPEAVGVLTAMVGLAGTATGAIGSLLVSTHSSPPPPPVEDPAGG